MVEPQKVPALLRPLSSKVYAFQVLGALSVVWGFALLPGGMTVAAGGIAFSLALYVLRHAHRVAQIISLGPSAPPIPAPSPKARLGMRIALYLIIFTHLDIPIGMTVQLVKLSARQHYMNTPSTEFPRHFVFVGCTIAHRESVGPKDVSVQVLGGGTLAFQYSSGVDDLRPYPYALWPAFERLHAPVRHYETTLYTF
ncbi:MAG TPA: hypothetical protein VL282_14310 [Tepidisphaeraceae bacterium]|nr:hypothetical protein [Tepidisphaeraceae bacterium]